MNHKTIRKKIHAIATRWIQRTGLGYQRIDIGYKKTFDGTEHEGCVGYCNTNWKYMTSYVVFNYKELEELDPKRFEEVVVHELMHIFLNEMREEGIDHEEHVATMLQKAFMWALVN
jgi:hypothetical protein